LNRPDEPGVTVDTRDLDIVLAEIGDFNRNTATYMLMWRLLTRWVQAQVGHPVELASWYGGKYQIVPVELEAPTEDLRRWWARIYDRRPKLYPTPRDSAVAYVTHYREYLIAKRTKGGRK
jgi:hypothetical protein